MRRWPPVLIVLLMVLLGAGCASGKATTAARTRPLRTAHASPRHSPAQTGQTSTPATSPASPASPTASPSPSPSAGPSLATERTLLYGAHGAEVKVLQRRLAALKYYPGPADGRFGPDTLEAVWAFQEVQGLKPSGAVGRKMWRALAHPRAPRALVPRGGALRVEVSLSREVLVLYRADRVALISHVSSGGGYYFCSPGGACGYAVTPTGNFRTVTFMPGWVTVPLGQMYNPVFFIGHAYAIHGDTDVPLQPVSHGCVRIPMDIAAFFHTLLPDTGTPVYIRG
jgi:Putative peptidoglycan binding domain/L,D-transpeptidase catalytic domain